VEKVAMVQPGEVPYADALADIASSVRYFLPELYCTLLLVTVVVVDAMLGKRYRTVGGWVAFAGLFPLCGLIVYQLMMLPPGVGQVLFSSMLRLDRFAAYFKLVGCALVILCSLFAVTYPKLVQAKTTLGEFFVLVVGLQLGLLLMPMATHLLMAYLSLEVVSICSYLLTVYTRSTHASAEAAVKYILYGAVSSGIMLYGISLLYGLTGSFVLNAQFAQALAAADSTAVWLAVLFLLAGLLYKVAAVPFHFWAPDVYQGALPPVGALLATASKAAGFALLIRILLPIQGILQGLPFVLGLLAIASMTLGNLAALGQKHSLRLLAYSSVANAGYVLLGIAVGTAEGTAAAMYFLLIYAAMKLSAFLTFSTYNSISQKEEVQFWSGLGQLSMPLALCTLVVLISLVGLPPSAGFVAKLYLFLPLWSAYANGNSFFLIVLAVAVINTVVSLFYYLRPVVLLIFRGPAVQQAVLAVRPIAAHTALVYLLTAALLWLGLFSFGDLFVWVQSCVPVLN